MKKTGVIVLAAALLGFVQFAQAQEVHSVNIVGFVKKTLPAGGTVLTTCNFDQIDGTTNTLLSVFGTNQLKTASGNYLLGDRIMLWDTAQAKYQAWVQFTTDKQFYKANSSAEWGTHVVGNPTIPAGTAMWVIAGSGGTTKDLVFSGEVVDVTTQKVNIVLGPQLISYPFTAAIDLQNTDFKNDGTKKASGNYLLGDQILVWTGTGYQGYCLFSGDSQWYKASSSAEWSSHVLASNTVNLAEGFWYIAKSGSAIITNGWSEVKPY